MCIWRIINITAILATSTHSRAIRKLTVVSRILFFLLPALVLFHPLCAQTEIGGIINEYSTVESITGSQSVTAGNPEIFQEGDTVLLIQMKGMSILLDPPVDYGKQQDINHAGNYEFLLIDEIDGNTITFTREFLKEYNAHEIMQLVSVKGYESARVTSTLTAKPWDGEKGGILAFIVTNTLILEANIDVSAKGFRGGGCLERNNNECAAGDPDEYKKFSFPAGSDKAGKKGEGPVSWYVEDEVIYPIGDEFVHGRGRMATGGGGGNGRYAGGGGGSNFGQGGLGGRESQSCPEFTVDGQFPRGMGGYRLEEQLSDTDGNFSNRLFFGGGGGGSTGDSGRPGTDGGHGGGLVVIIANYIEASDEYGIYADGESIIPPAAGGGGGGGGGGTIISSTDNYNGTINFFARGGKGGDVDHISMAGPGGGGGGGTIAYSGTTLPSNANTALQQGTSGTNTQQNDPFGTTIASSGVAVGQLEISLNGLLFNGIRTASPVVCEDIRPDTIEGTQPRGGKPHYIYRWAKRTEGNQWMPVPGETGRDYRPEELDQTTQFIRVVIDQDGDPVIDTSNVLTITVQPKIMGNIISEEQTICEGETPFFLTGDEPAQGGTGIFEYAWSKYTEAAGEWSRAGDQNNLPDFSPLSLHDTTLYMRIATSGVCTDSSNIVPVNVHPSITNNSLVRDQTICYGDIPGPVEAPEGLGGGLGPGSYSYTWDKRTDGPWSTISGEGGEAYLPDELHLTAYFRRTVTSGVCSSTSEEHKITVLPRISDNSISGDQTICYLDSPALFTGSDPAGGDGIYSYAWQVATGDDQWTAAPDNYQEKDYRSPALSDTSYFRRIVHSGDGNACTDTSNLVLIEFHPFSYARIIEKEDIICNGEQPEITFALKGGDIQGEWALQFSDGEEHYSVAGTDDTIRVTVAPHTVDSATFSYRLVSLTDKYGCSVPDENMTGEASVRVYAYPDPDPGTDGEVCGPIYELNASAGLGNILWESEYGAEFNNPTGRSTSVTVSEYGTHIFKYTESNWQCQASAEISVTFYEQPDRTDAGEDQNLQFQFDTYLEATLPIDIPTAHGMWELMEGTGTVYFPDDPGTMVTDLGFGTNVMKWTVFNGVCEPVSDLVTITVNDLHTPNAFSPNNSGYNDMFVIRGLENSAVNELTVFNRQGNVVYRSQNYGNDWDGRNLNGDHLPEDTYFYILSVDNLYSYKGFIILKR